MSTSRPGSIRPLFFETPAALRRWLQANHRTASEAWIGFYKKSSGRPSVTYHEALDEALCFGWIDGIRRGIDAASYMNRFTPRRKGSHWSVVNIARARELIAAGRMRAAGRKAFETRDEGKAPARSAPAALEFDDELAAAFRRRRDAWTFFQAQPPGYRRGMIGWVVSAKLPATRERRLAALVAASAAGRRLDPMKPLGGRVP